MSGTTINADVGATVTLGSGAYPSPLTITSGGTVSAPNNLVGVYAAATAGTVSVLNQGSIFGGGPDGYSRGVGGDGLDLLAVASLTNSGLISGGTAGRYSDPYAFGGVGADLAAGGTVVNSGTILGGTGGNYEGGRLVPGNGGVGGDGVDIASGYLDNVVVIDGGDGGAGGSSAPHGFGGDGGYGVKLSDGSLTNSGTITGGAGGLDGGDFAGAGLVVGNSAAASNDGTILGGQGGNGGFSRYGGPGYAGAGGAGAIVNGGTLTDTGTILGGNGGVVGQAGAGGDGVIMDGGTLIAYGTIAGGYVGGGTQQFDAVYFSGAAGTLVLEPGAVFGGVVAGNGLGVLDLVAGVGATTLTGLGTVFTGFTQIGILSGGDWTLPSNFTGGGGGAAVVAASDDTLTISGGVVVAGGGGRYGNSTRDGGTGNGAISLGANDGLNNSGIIAGGAGGIADASNVGGAAGVGLALASDDDVTNSGTISGGNGGGAPNGMGGRGGDAVDLSGGMMTNTGAIKGGSGGVEAANGDSGYASVIATGGVGIELEDGATLINDGTVRGGSLAAGAEVDDASLTNSQYLAGTYRGDGADLSNGATLLNTGTIAGGSGLGNAIVDDTVIGPVANGVALRSGSVLTNDGTIIAAIGGSGAVLDDSTMINDGTLAGYYLGDGASLSSGASMSNEGFIEGGGKPYAGGAAVGAGVALAANTTLTNDGTIAGHFSDGAYLAAGATLINHGGITAAYGNGVQLATGAELFNTGTIAGGGDSSDGAILNGGVLVNSGTIARGLYAPGVMLNGGTLITSGTIVGVLPFSFYEPPHSGPGGSYPGGTYNDPGFAAVQFGSAAATLIVDPGAVFVGAVQANSTISDTLELGVGSGGGTLGGLGGTITGFGAIAFDAGASWMVQGNAAGLASGQTITGFAGGDTIDLQNISFGLAPTISTATDSVTITGDGTSATFGIVGAGAESFAVVPDAASTGSDLSVQCFREGTRIRTARGEVAVEALCVGDLVATEFSGLVPVRWLGTRAIDCRRHKLPANAWPVRVREGAFDGNAPARDVFLSPDHAVFIDDVLIPVRYLVNGRTIAQERCDTVTYWHVELGQHDVIFAEGLRCETYLDTGNRGAFTNGGTVVQLTADFALNVWEAESCAKLVLDGASLEAARSWLLVRAEMLGHTTSRDAAPRVVVGGQVVQPTIDGRWHRFELPPGGGAIRLVSRHAMPAETRADSGDHRRLGIAVSRLVADGRPIALVDPRLGSGWHGTEDDGAGVAWRWTDGDAGLALAGVRVLDVEIAMTERYWASEAADERRVA